MWKSVVIMLALIILWIGMVLVVCNMHTCPTERQHNIGYSIQMGAGYENAN